MSYLGSKHANGAFQAIIAQMSPHDTYIETHLGGGAVMQRKPPAARSVLPVFPHKRDRAHAPAGAIRQTVGHNAPS